MTAQEMWEEYRKLNPDADAYEAWAFCGGGAAGDELAKLTLQGIKTATASSLIAYACDDEIPTAGCYSVILYDNGEAACVIRDTIVSIVPFDEVSPEHAYREGEDDRSLAMWRDVHRRFCTPDYEAAGKPFDEHGLCVLEEFEVVYK